MPDRGKKNPSAAKAGNLLLLLRQRLKPWPLQNTAIRNFPEKALRLASNPRAQDQVGDIRYDRFIREPRIGRELFPSGIVAEHIPLRVQLRANRQSSACRSGSANADRRACRQRRPYGTRHFGRSRTRPSETFAPSPHGFVARLS